MKIFRFIVFFVLIASCMISVNATDLQQMIDSAPDGGTVTLTSDFFVGNTITINKDLTINSATNKAICNINQDVFVGLKIATGCNVNFINVNFIGFKNYAIHSEGGALSFDKCEFSSSRGGVNSKNSNLVFTNCDFRGIFNNSVLNVNNVDLTLNGSVFNKNDYFGGSGSCINSVNTKKIDIDKCVFSDNHADIRGGCISLDGDGYSSSVSGSRVYGNSANGGGFLFTTGESYKVGLTGNNFNNNRAVGHDSGSSVNGVGGVILSTTVNSYSYSYLLSGNSISDDNVATGGGGLLACFREGGSFTFNGNTFADNLWFRNNVLQIEARNNIFDGDDI
jgi:hypothetical protein